MVALWLRVSREPASHPPSTSATSNATAVHLWNKGRTTHVNAALKVTGVTKTRSELETDYEITHPRPLMAAGVPASGPLTMTQILQHQTKIPLPPTVILPLLHRST